MDGAFVIDEGDQQSFDLGDDSLVAEKSVNTTPSIAVLNMDLIGSTRSHLP